MTRVTEASIVLYGRRSWQAGPLPLRHGAHPTGLRPRGPRASQHLGPPRRRDLRCAAPRVALARGGKASAPWTRSDVPDSPSSYSYHDAFRSHTGRLTSLWLTYTSTDLHSTT